MEFLHKKFEELSPKEIYEILKSRSEVFMLEQGIRCLDMDDKDYISHHFFLWENDRAIAYLRAFYPDPDRILIGRVLTLCHGKGHGRVLMESALEEILEKMPAKEIVISSQSHAVTFYEKFGFSVISEPYDEEGIPHVKMQRKVEA